MGRRDPRFKARLLTSDYCAVILEKNAATSLANGCPKLFIQAR